MNVRHRYVLIACALFAIGVFFAISRKPASLVERTFYLHGSGQPQLKDGQVLSGVAQLVLEPFSRMPHFVGIAIDGELIYDYEFPTNAALPAVFELDTTQFPPGEHVLSTGGEVYLSSAKLRHSIQSAVTGEMMETKLLKEKTWRVRFAEVRNVAEQSQ